MRVRVQVEKVSYGTVEVDVPDEQWQNYRASESRSQERVRRNKIADEAFSKELDENGESRILWQNDPCIRATRNIEPAEDRDYE